MKVYFTASLRGKATFEESYSSIVNHLKYRGFKVYADHIMADGIENKVSDQSEDERKKVYKDLLNKVKEADLVVAEISTPSVSVGHEISFALEQAKPVIVMHVPGKSSSLLEGIKDDHLKIVSYSNDDVVKKLDEAVEEASKIMDVRFNFFVNPKILAYLDWVSQNRRIPRSVFLRNLIEREMKKDKEYKAGE